MVKMDGKFIFNEIAQSVKQRLIAWHGDDSAESVPCVAL